MSWGDFQNEKLYKGGYNRLRSWKDDGNIEVWIHTNSAFYKRLFIMIPYVGEEEDEKTGKTKRTIKYFPYVSHEEINDYISRKKNGEYYRCPLLRLIDWLTDNGYVDDDQTVYDASIGDKKRDRVCTKADFINDIPAGGTWQLSMKPTMQYVMAVIDNATPKDGIVVTAEKYSLGEKIKGAVRKEIDRKGPELGDPGNNPYCFKWVFNTNANNPNNYYDAYPYERVELTDDIAELLAQPAQDISDWVMPGDTDFLRKIFEAHITVDDVPWDDLFDNVHEERSVFGGTDTEEQDDVEEEKEKKSKPKRGRPKSKKSASKPEPEPEPEPEDDESEDEDSDTVTCPSCKGKGKKRNKKCKVCDGTGEIEAPDDDGEPDESPPPEPDKKQRRARKPKPKPKPEPEPEPEDDEGEDECGNCHKSIPYDANECPHCGCQFE